MDAHKRAALLHRQDSGDQRALHPLLRGQIQRQTNDGLTAGTQQNRQVKAVQLLQMVDDRKILLIGLAEPDARIQNDLVGVDARVLGDGQALLEICADVRNEHTVIAVLPVVHQAAGHTVFCNDRAHFFVILQAPDVIDKVCARLQAGLRHGALVGIQRDRHIKAGLHRLNNGGDPVDLLLVGQLCIARTGRFAADVQHIHAVHQHLLNMVEGGIHVVELPAVRERVRGDIQDAHHIGGTPSLKVSCSDLDRFHSS